jgi:hypothetical protein
MYYTKLYSLFRQPNAIDNFIPLVRDYELDLFGKHLSRVELAFPFQVIHVKTNKSTVETKLSICNILQITTVLTTINPVMLL